jgi:UDP-N-acetylmuramate dehydrogenase
LLQNPDQLALHLSQVADGEVKTNVMLAPYTSYRIGGPSAVWAAPESEAGIAAILKIVRQTGIPLFILGRGSNLLVSDHGWPGLTLYLGANISKMTFEGLEAEAMAGTELMALVTAAVNKGLAGVELLAGIPGGVGGALRMNAGAFGQEIESAALAVSVFFFDGTPFHALRREIDFDYRRVPGLERIVITRGRFRFKKAQISVLKARVHEILDLRVSKQPLDHPSCGSIFKRPPGYYAGALIEETGLKRERIGGAMVSEKHAGFILNVDNARAADVYALIRRIENKVLERFGVQLEREVKLIGEFE